MIQYQKTMPAGEDREGVAFRSLRDKGVIL